MHCVWLSLFDSCFAYLSPHAPQLYPSLCELAHVLSVDGPVRQRLDSLAGELAKAADKELQVETHTMILTLL